MGKTDTSLCRICNEFEEDIEHLFINCPLVNSLWEDIKQIDINGPTVALDTSPTNLLLGSWSKTKETPAYNIIYLLVKHYIFRCAKRRKIPILTELKQYVKEIYVEQEELSKTFSKKLKLQFDND